MAEKNQESDTFLAGLRVRVKILNIKIFPDKCTSILPLHLEQEASGGDTKDTAFVIFIFHCYFQ